MTMLNTPTYDASLHHGGSVLSTEEETENNEHNHSKVECDSCICMFEYLCHIKVSETKTDRRRIQHFTELAASLLLECQLNFEEREEVRS